MKLVFISDTHGLHDQLVLPKGDVLIHAGDISMQGRPYEVLNFLNWFGRLRFKHKIFIAGNHDFFFQEKSHEEIHSIIPKGVTYLNDSGCEVEGVRIWGSPIQPEFHNWAFNRQRGEEIRKHWDMVPSGTDILITHGPMFGRHDLIYSGQRVGCEELAKVVDAIKPKLHVCGHIHEAYGLLESEHTVFANASVLNLRYKLVNPPIEYIFA